EDQGRCPRLLKVVPSRHQSASEHLYDVIVFLWFLQDKMLHIALWCLEGTTMSNWCTSERSGDVPG
ncbi:MAG: hypothetical protein SPE98_01005, partial [Bacteroidaceae bacterium]|nr:hypothetical protein [Bacteroidaceae bacterium]